MSILVLGGAGYIGSHTALELIRTGESVVDPLKYYDNNLCGTKILLDSMVEHHIDKIVFSQPLPPMVNRKIFRFLKQTEHSQPIHMVKPNLLWRRCSIGLQKLMA